MIRSTLQKILFYLILFILIAASASAQYSSDYVPLNSSAPLPDDFLKPVKQSIEDEIKKLSPHDKEFEEKKQFAASSNYAINYWLLSGTVLVNDPIEKYINKVADNLLKSDPSLRNSLHIYVNKSTTVDTHTFDEGYIFINMGLIAQLENEAQLAYILAREIAHIKKKHAYTEFINVDKTEKGYIFNDEEYEYLNLAKNRFTTESETEADLNGLNLIKSSEYSVKAANGVFDVFQYAYLPFELTDFKKSFFEDANFILPDTFILKKTNIIKEIDENTDARCIHPNIHNRRQTIYPDLKAEDESSRKKFILPVEDFKSCREIARFELCRLYLQELDYVNAIYAAYVLLQKYPDNIYLKKTVIKALYNITIYKSGKTRNESSTLHKTEAAYYNLPDKYSVPTYKYIQGPSQRLYYLLDHLSADELNTMAVSYTYKAAKAVPEDYELKAITDSLLSELANVNHLFINTFSRMSKAQLKSTDSLNANKNSSSEEGKYSKIKQQQEKMELNTQSNFIKYAFVDFLKDEGFVNHYERLTRKPTKPESFEQKKSRLAKEHYFNAEKILILDPYYVKVTLGSDGKEIDFNYSEQTQTTFLLNEKKCAEQLKINHVDIDSKQFNATDIDKYNTYCILKNWVAERIKHGENNDVLIANSEDVKKTAERTGCEYMAWSGIYNFKTVGWRNTYFFSLFNLKTGEILKHDVLDSKTSDYGSMTTIFTYNSFKYIGKANPY